MKLAQSAVPRLAAIENIQGAAREPRKKEELRDKGTENVNKVRVGSGFGGSTWRGAVFALRQDSLHKGG